MSTLSRPLGPFKRQPRIKQMEALKLSAEREYFALFLEQRCGKSQVVIDTAAHNFRLGRISCLLIIAPNGVHRNWVTDEIPAVMPDDVRWKAIYWQSGRMEQVGRKAELYDLLAHDGLAILAVNIDAIITEFGKKVIRAFLNKRPTLAVLDESLDISAPGAKRTKTAQAIGRHATMRRILDGTPIDATPLGLYSQTNFLKPGLLGFSTFATFKAHYAEYEERARRDGVTYPALVGYRNLDEMKQRLAGFSFRVTRQECVDLPPKIYEKRYFPLPEKHRRLYDQLRKETIAELENMGTIDGTHVLTRYLRLQQITSNHTQVQSNPVPCPACQGRGDDDCERCEGFGIVPADSRVIRIAETDPRQEAFLHAVAPLRGQGIIWAKFRSDYQALREAAQKAGARAVCYYGDIPADERADAIRAFQSGKADWFIGNPHAGGRGLDLSGANWMVYYSHDFALRWRRQSEDRAQSLAKKDSVLYIDLIAENTVDEKIIAALREGKNLSDLVTGDKPEAWI